MLEKKIDKPFFILSLCLVFFGILIFYSAALGAAAKSNIEYSSIIYTQLFVGLVLGIICSIGILSIKHTFFRKISIFLFFISLFAVFLVFFPGLGYEYNGARRWLSIAGFSFQPTELLKFASIVFFAAWISKFQKRNEKTRFGTVSFLIVMAIVSLPLMLQPDFDAVVLVALPLFTILLISKAPIKHILVLAVGGIIALIILGASFSHVRDRVMSYINPSDTRGSSFQIDQALQTVGSGEFWGKGYGKSTQKFTTLPEPLGDSIFAIYAEEMGFFGSSLLIILYTLWALRGYRIATHSKDNFIRYFITGSVTLIILQSFVNIASMLAIIPIVGMPLVFVSHGGTALLINLCIVALILNMSRHQTQ